MIEIAEAVCLAGQMRETLVGKEITACLRGNQAHKFAFYSGDAAFYAATLPGKTLGEAYARGNAIVLPALPGYALVLGMGGERIRYHPSAETIPARHQFLLRFRGGDALSVTVQMWGAAQLQPLEELDFSRNFYGLPTLDPLGAEFTPAWFRGLFAALPAGCRDTLKFFLISKPGVWGLGNGYTQDILFHAGLHPKRRAISLTLAEQERLYTAIRSVLQEAVRLGGRVSEEDLFGQGGGYQPVLDKQGYTRPCPRCGGAIGKMQLQGGASYFCPHCQPL